MREVEIWIPGKLPGQNDIIAACKARTGRRTTTGGLEDRYSIMKRAHSGDIGLLVRVMGNKPFDRPVRVHCLWYEENGRRDPDNVAAGVKFVLDGLVKGGLIQDDSPKWVVGIDNDYVYGAGYGVKLRVKEALPWQTPSS